MKRTKVTGEDVDYLELKKDFYKFKKKIRNPRE